MIILEKIKKLWATSDTSEALPSVIEQYNAARNTPFKENICNAPFNNMYFNVLGQVGPCWLTYLGGDTWPQKTIHQIWFGQRFNSIRNQIKKCDLSGQCIVCKNNIDSGNFMSSLSVAYDIVPVQQYPTMMEFELNNTCNLECVMCKGELSSSIRKNRDKLPAIKSPYTQDFVEQLKEFIPHLSEARFNGGEPFLINIYFSIWEEIIRLNPQCKITIATNGTVLNYKVKNILERGDFSINLSLDGFTKQSYESIRVNGHFDRVLENMHWFIDYCKRKETTFCLLVNPMRQNWHEMPEFVQLCNRLDIPLWLNTIDYPVDQSFASWSYNNLKLAYETLSKITFQNEFNIVEHRFERNKNIYNNFVFIQLKNWMDQAQQRESAADSIALPAEGSIYFLFANEAAPPDNIGRERKRFFLQLYHTLLTEFKMGDEEARHTLSELYIAIQQVYNHINQRVDAESFFELLNRYPPKIIIETLKTQNAEWVTEKIESMI